MSSLAGTRERIGFRLLHARLVRHVTLLIQNGGYTERGLARSIGISQAHMHNVLKGERNLSPEFADRLLAHLDMSLLDLMLEGEVTHTATGRKELPDVAMAEARAFLATIRREGIPRKPSARQISVALSTAEIS